MPRILVLADEQRPDSAGSRFRHGLLALTGAATTALGRGGDDSPDTTVLVFDLELLNVRGVRASLAVAAHQHLTALHDAIQTAFGWHDDHLYSFWLDGEFWGDRGSEFTTPEAPDEARQTAEVPLAELDLTVGARMAYIFDFGEEWRVQLVLRQQIDADGGAYPRVVARKGTPPPQYPEHTDD